MTGAPPNLIQKVLGVFNPTTGALIGLATSGETPYNSLMGNAQIVPSFAALRLAPKATTTTVFATGAVTQADGGGGVFVLASSDTSTGAWFTGSVTGSVLTVASVNNGTLVVGQSINRGDTGASIGTILSFGTGAGGVGTYNLSAAASIAGPLVFSADNNGTRLVGADGGRWYLAPQAASSITSILDFGADNTGSLDSTSAMQLAALAGVDLFVPDGTYKITGPTVFGNAQTVTGAGRGRVKFVCSGNYDIFTWNGGFAGGGMSDVTVDATLMTGGKALVNNNSNRGTFNNIMILNPYNGIYITKTNVCSLKNVWINGTRSDGTIGGFCIWWYGDAANRSDVLDIDNVEVSGAASGATSPYGFIMDGNVDTCDMRHFAAVNVRIGVLTQNSGGGPAPQFLSGYDVQVDFPYLEGVKLLNGMKSALFTDMYLHGSLTGNGILVDSTVQHVSWQGGKNDSHFQRGGYLDGRYIHIANVQNSTNSQEGSALWPGWQIGPNSIGVRINGGLSGKWIGYALELQSYGIQTDVGAQAYCVSGVDLRLNVTGAYLDNAADSTSIIAFNNQDASTPHIINAPIQMQAGTLRLNGAPGAFGVDIGHAINGIGFNVAIPDVATVNHIQAIGHATGVSPSLNAITTGADTILDFVVVSLGVGAFTAQNGNGRSFQAAAADANTVNFFKAFGHATGVAPRLAAIGSDANINAELFAKGINQVSLGNDRGIAFVAIASDPTTVNHIEAFGHATGSAPALGAEGSDTNIDLDLLPKGSGVVQFGNAGSLIANGSVATALTSVGPVGSHTTVQEWLQIKNNSGTVRYIPLF